jgi:hypothetical protein
MLGTAYGEGRLTRDEYDARLEGALSARTYADLDKVVADLPAAQATPPARPAPGNPENPESLAKVNGLAFAGFALVWAAVILGIALLIVGLAISAGMHGGMPMR